MARPVYSIQIVSLSPIVGPRSTTVVPDGVKIIVRDVDIWNASGVAGDSFGFQSAASGYLWLVKRAAADVGTYQWRGRQVFNPGESIVFEVFSGTWAVQASGYELTL